MPILENLFLKEFYASETTLAQKVVLARLDKEFVFVDIEPPSSQKKFTSNLTKI